MQVVDITDKDDEKSKSKKRKLQKGWKSQQRFAKLDAETQKRQQSWMDFKKGKGSKKKVPTPSSSWSPSSAFGPGRPRSRVTDITTMHASL